jgi:predicted AlkP superfamily pyrophosphatase or phosphodiesterase
MTQQIDIINIDNNIFLKWIYDLLQDIKDYPKENDGLTKDYIKAEARRLLSFIQLEKEICVNCDCNDPTALSSLKYNCPCDCHKEVKQ